MARQCAQCGAPLHAVRVGEVSRCPFCGLVARAEDAPQAPAREQPPGSPQTAKHPGAIVAGLFLGVVCIAGPWAYRLLTPPPRVPAAPQPAAPHAVVPARARMPPPARMSWAPSPPGCEVDANGDGVVDMAGLSGDPGQDKAPTLLDGATGKLIWRGEPVSSRVQLGCLGKDWLFVAAPNFEVSLFSARTPGAPVRALLRDTIDEYGLGKGCASFKTADGAVTGLQLPGGVTVRCDAPRHRYYGGRKPGLMGLTENSTEIARGTRRYRVHKRNNGTPILTLEVEDGGKLLWKKELPYAAPTFSTGLTVGGGAIALWAAQPGARERGMLVGFDEASGEQLYEKAALGMVSNDVGFFGFNGRHIVVQYWNVVDAFEPRSGERAWQVYVGP